MQTSLPRRRPAARALAAALGLMLASVAAAGAPSPALLQRCAACHGASGNTASAALYPNLAGQSAAYIELQLNKSAAASGPMRRCAPARRA